ncbi:hypothetical protein EXIGLDRAFT_783338 [Exidia glandulosa HHB12029]|uniref:Uncharacterized protein n=1 Tax=Exidia glandulosa HHB12029 TaxID=1314781 RepID=A0A166N4G7_EXIGL|nr:hypothetical protein EXIGLDRAFT_783338 [Exidia glandulosa HHB12029]
MADDGWAAMLDSAHNGVLRLFEDILPPTADNSVPSERDSTTPHSSLATSSNDFASPSHFDARTSVPQHGDTMLSSRSLLDETDYRNDNTSAPPDTVNNSTPSFVRDASSAPDPFHLPLRTPSIPDEMNSPLPQFSAHPDSEKLHGNRWIVTRESTVAHVYIHPADSVIEYPHTERNGVAHVFPITPLRDSETGQVSYTSPLGNIIYSRSDPGSARRRKSRELVPARRYVPFPILTQRVPRIPSALRNCFVSA